MKSNSLSGGKNEQRIYKGRCINVSAFCNEQDKKLQPEQRSRLQEKSLDAFHASVPLFSYVHIPKEPGQHEIAPEL